MHWQLTWQVTFWTMVQVWRLCNKAGCNWQTAECSCMSVCILAKPDPKHSTKVSMCGHLNVGILTTIYYPLRIVLGGCIIFLVWSCDALDCIEGAQSIMNLLIIMRFVELKLILLREALQIPLSEEWWFLDVILLLLSLVWLVNDAIRLI